MPKYGTWWNDEVVCTKEWYDDIHSRRMKIHKFFLDWARKQAKEREITLSSVLEVGCGSSMFYSNKCFGQHYVGVDVSEWAIEACKNSKPANHHEFFAGNVEDMEFNMRFDIVFAHAVIDHVGDIDKFLKKLCELSQGLVFLSSYRGYFPDSTEHDCKWSAAFSCWFNDISPNAIRRCVAETDHKVIDIIPLSNPSEKRTETIIMLESSELHKTAVDVKELNVMEAG